MLQIVVYGWMTEWAYHTVEYAETESASFRSAHLLARLSHLKAAAQAARHAA
jgi:hypothetical protein